MANQDLTATIREAARFIRSSRYLTAFTGAGISVESGIPPFRGRLQCLITQNIDSVQ
jgi:NAD-dependent SIR2 family protein deacetylase